MRVTVSAEEAVGDVLPGGVHGNGLDHDADVEIQSFSYPCKKFPNYDKNGERATYAHFLLRVTPLEGPMTGKSTFIDHWVQSDGLRRALISADVTIDVGPDGKAFDFDDEELQGKKLRGIELKEPREYNGALYTGNVRGFVAD